MSTRAMLLVALAVFLIAGIVRADDVPILTGSGLKIQNAVSKCQTIFTGQVTNSGVENSDLDHESLGPELRGVRVKILQILRGTSHGIVLVMLNINVNAVKHETAPQAGGSYIFFIYSHDVLMGTPDTVLKLLPATKANILAVKLAIVGQGT